MDYGSAVAHRLAPKKPVSKPTKSMHVEELHDGTYHIMKNHGNGQSEKGSASDLDDAHDVLEEHFGGPASEEEFRGNTKKQGTKEKAPETDGE